VTSPLNAFSNSAESIMAKYTMGVAVRITGIPAHRIRKYEECGLCTPERTGSKQRLFSDKDIEVMHKISDYEKDGVNLQGIKIILEMQNRSNRI
jgi:MerR family transcriptional regulator, heat shock protein HspR